MKDLDVVANGSVARSSSQVRRASSSSTRSLRRPTLDFTEALVEILKQR